MSLLRVRFFTTEPRPVNWPVKHPFWITGYSGDCEYSIVVSYADVGDLEYIMENWPEANNIEADKVDGYKFTDRFPMPDWFERDQLRAETAALRAQLDAANEDAEAILVALKLILDCVDYTSGSCGLTEMVGGALPAQIIRKARAALASHEARINEALKGGEE